MLGILRDLQTAGFVDPGAPMDVDLFRMEKDLARVGVSLDYLMLASGHVEIDRESLPACGNSAPRPLARNRTRRVRTRA